MKSGTIAIVGAAESSELGILPHISELQLHADAALNAMKDAGLRPSDIDGVATAVHQPTAIAHYLGITPKWVDGTSVGGCSFMLHVRHAAAAIEAGYCRNVLITHGESGRSGIGLTRFPTVPASLPGQFELPFGVSGPPTMFTIPVLRYMKEFGLTHEQAAQAVGRSRSAASNLLRLLNLAEPVQTMLMAGDLEMGHARALLALERSSQITAATRITARKMSVREAEAMVKKLGAEFTLTSAKPKGEKSRDLKRLEEELSDHLTAEVEVRVKKRVKRGGKMTEMGELAIQFGSLEELNGLIDKISGGASR